MMAIKAIITRVIEDFIIIHAEIFLKVIATDSLEVEVMAVHDPGSRNCAVFMSYTCINSFESHLQGVAPRSQYSDPAPEAVTLQ